MLFSRRFFVCSVLSFCVGVLFWYSLSGSSKEFLIVTFLDVGQGDSILITSPSGVQMLIDTGPNQSVLRALGKEMSFFDRDIDIMMITHPDADHVGGSAAVFDRYSISGVLRTKASSGTHIFETFEQAVLGEGSDVVYAERGMLIDMGESVYVQILFPEEYAVSGGNGGSIVAKVIYGEVSFLLTGDASISVEEYLIPLEGSLLQSDILKLGHHGSRTSTSEIFLQKVSPEEVVISAGEGNRYGHPHQEVLDILDNFEVEYLETSKEGNISFVSDGKGWWRE